MLSLESGLDSVGLLQVASLFSYQEQFHTFWSQLSRQSHGRSMQHGAELQCGFLVLFIAIHIEMDMRGNFQHDGYIIVRDLTLIPV